VVDLATILTTHLSDVIRQHAHELVGRQEVQKMLDTLKESHPKVVEELVPNLVSLGGVVRIIQNLLVEQVPIRDLTTILEAWLIGHPVSRIWTFLRNMSDRHFQERSQIFTRLKMASFTCSRWIQRVRRKLRNLPANRSGCLFSHRSGICQIHHG
jgi:hypothetical protein